MSVKLTDAQLVMMSAAAQRKDRCLSAPATIKGAAWAKREAQIDGVVDATVGMYGDLQGIAGRALQEIEGLQHPLLEGVTGENDD
jgi:hypothetical protein